MLKFFRKYNTIILVVGGVFLMIAFLLPQAIQQFTPNFSNRTLFRVGGETFGRTQVGNASRQQAVLSETLDPIIGFRGSHQIMLNLESTDHWITLGLAAEQAGLYNPGGTAEDILPRILAFSGINPTQAQLDQVAQLFEMAAASVRDRELALDALRRMDSIMRLRNLYGYSNLLSEPELALYSSRLFDTLEIDLGVVSGESYANTLDPPTESEITSLYERYRDADPADNPYGFSYRLDDAVKFEMLVIDREIVSDAIELDPIEVRKYHRVNISTRGYPDEFNAIASVVESDLRKEKTDEVMSSIKNAVNNALLQSQSRLERGDNGLRVLPTDWPEQRPDFDQLAEAANSTANRLVALPEPPARVLQYTDEWMTSEDMSLDPDLLSLRLEVLGGRSPLSRALFALPEFESQVTIPDAQVGLTIRGISAMRTDDEGFVRVLDIRRAGPPASIDLVRERVERDAMAMKGYEALETQLDQLVSAAAKDDGLVGAVLELAEEGPMVGTGMLVQYYDQRTGSESFVNVTADITALEASGLVNFPEFAADLIQRTVTWDPRTEVSAIPIEDRTFGIMVPQSQSLAIVVVTNRRPVTAESLRRLWRQTSTFIATQVSASDPTVAMTSSLGRRALADRLGFKMLDLTEESQDLNPYFEPENAG